MLKKLQTPLAVMALMAMMAMPLTYADDNKAVAEKEQAKASGQEEAPLALDKQEVELEKDRYKVQCKNVRRTGSNRISRRCTTAGDRHAEKQYVEEELSRNKADLERAQMAAEQAASPSPN